MVGTNAKLSSPAASSLTSRIGPRLPRSLWNFGDDDPGVIVTQ
jgi:hypothetical protein